MSRYLRQLMRQTRAVLRPPSHLRLAPRAPALFDEVHEERILQPPPETESRPVLQPAERETPRVFPQRAESIVPATPEKLFRPPERPSHAPAGEGRTNAQPSQSRPAPEPHAAIARAEATVPATKRAEARKSDENRPSVPIPERVPQGDLNVEILEVQSGPLAPPMESARPVPQALKSLQNVIPESVRTWLRTEPERPAPVPSRESSPVPGARQPAAQMQPQPIIDVTIGRIEVTIEGESQLPLRAARRTPAPPRPSTPAGLGRLARQYLDR